MAVWFILISTSVFHFANQKFREFVCLFIVVNDDLFLNLVEVILDLSIVKKMFPERFLNQFFA